MPCHVRRLHASACHCLRSVLTRYITAAAAATASASAAAVVACVCVCVCAGFLANVFDVFRANQVSVDVVATSEVSISLSLDPKKSWSDGEVGEVL